MSEYGFNKNHYLLIGASVAIFGVFLFSRSGIHLSAMFSRAAEDIPQLTYEDVKGEIYANYDLESNSDYAKELQKQFALLDRGQADGQVLGEAIGIGTVPKADQVFTRELLDQVNFPMTPDNSQHSLQRYADQVLFAESQNNAIMALANLNNSDEASLRDSKEQSSRTISSLLSITVPSSLADYHRYKLIYYQNLITLADSFISGNQDTDFQNLAAILLSVMERLDQIRAETSTKYQVQL